MKYDCGMIRDLMPLCIDGIGAEGSKAAVEAHIAECKECAAEWETLRAGGELYTETPVPEETKKFAKTAKRVRRKRVLLLVTVALVTAIVVAAVSLARFMKISGGRFDAQKAALIFDSYTGNNAEEVIAEYTPAIARKVFWIKSTDSDGKSCIDTVEMVMFDGLWFGAGYYYQMPYPQETGIFQTSREIIGAVEAVFPFMCTDRAVKQITMTWEGLLKYNPAYDANLHPSEPKYIDAPPVTADVQDNGFSMIEFDVHAKDVPPTDRLTGTATDAAGNVLYTLHYDDGALVWTPAA